MKITFMEDGKHEIQVDKIDEIREIVETWYFCVYSNDMYSEW